MLDRLYLGMITLRDRRIGDLLDPLSELGDKRRRLLDCSWARVFREHHLDDLPIQELLPHFDDRLGRPSKDLHIVIGVLLLQQLHDLSDAATVEALAFNIAWHHALDVRVEADCHFCEKTLRNYRRLFRAYLAKPSKDLQTICARAGMNMDAVIDRVKKLLPDAPKIEIRKAAPADKPLKKKNVIHDHDGKRLTATECSAATGIAAATIRHRLCAGWSVADALATGSVAQID